MSARNSIGIQYALVTAVISGFSIFLNKFAVTAIPQPLLFTTLKNSLVAVLIVSLILAGKKWHLVRHLSHKHIIQLALIGIIGGSLPFYLFFTGLSSIPAINGAIIHKTLVIWVSLLAILFLKEKLSPAKILAVIGLFAANTLFGGFPGLKFSPGELMVLAATLFWSIETIIAKKVLSSVDPDIVTAARMGLGSVVLFLLLLTTHNPQLTTVLNFNLTQWSWVFLTAGLLFAYVSAWYRALKFAPAATVTVVLVSSTLITNTLSAVFITHSLNQQIILQSLMILVCIYIINRTNKPGLEPACYIR